MFGLSQRELLSKMVKNACENNLSVYENGIKDYMAEFGDIDDEELAISLGAEQKQHEVVESYFTAVYSSIRESLHTSSPKIAIRFDFAVQTLCMGSDTLGLGKLDMEYFQNGIPAGIVFALAYYAFTNKRITSNKLTQTCVMLNHYQIALMDRVLDQYESNS
ncbi:hypothetical protein [Butyricicoccus pullicaecorum]|uniref:hypothetical protein n=1 Tax=Butyricicoccus pullicaecorum TaxID=501571 RepID=UPI003990BD97